MAAKAIFIVLILGLVAFTAWSMLRRRGTGSGKGTGSRGSNPSNREIKRKR